jgi:hypothetical protein
MILVHVEEEKNIKSAVGSKLVDGVKSLSTKEVIF